MLFASTKKMTKRESNKFGLWRRFIVKQSVYLFGFGEKTKETDGALEDIRLAANKELTAHSKKEIYQQAVLTLLQWPWFQRIWVREQNT